jgi:hypothetical protein
MPPTQAAADAVRDAILRYLYRIHGAARSVRATAITIRDLQSALRPLGYKQQEVASNLDYLIQKGWVVEVVEDRTYTTPRGTTQHSDRRSYKISAAGMDLLDGGNSLYGRSQVGSSINVTNVNGVTVVGDGNVVNTGYANAAEALSKLRDAVLKSEISDETRLVVAADIDTLQAQLQKPEPDPGIIKLAWSGIREVVTAGELAELGFKVGALLAPILGG